LFDFIEKMFELGDAQLTSKSVGIVPSTGCGWLKRWNEEGLNGLILKYSRENILSFLKKTIK